MTSKLLIFTLIISIFILSSYSWGQQDLDLDRKLSSEGYITISWQDSYQSIPVTIQVAADASFKQLLNEIKLINQNSIHLSGLKNGNYFVRMLAENNDVSSTSSFVVQHRNIQDAFMFFALGAILFLFLIVILIKFSAKF